MTSQALFGLSIPLSLAAYTLVAGIYVWPWLLHCRQFRLCRSNPAIHV